MSDLIDRQAAIDAIEKLALPQTKGETAAEEINRVAWRCAINCAEEMIGHLPSAEKTGVWKCVNLDNFGKYKVICPFCGAEYADNYDGYVDTYMFNYCPNCGAKLEVE